MNLEFDKDRKNCFLSYSFDSQTDYFIKTNIIPILQENNYYPQTVLENDIFTGNFYSFIYQSVKDCDLLVCDLTFYSYNTIFELALANAWIKPVIILIDQNRSAHNDYIPINNTIMMYNGTWASDKQESSDFKIQFGEIIKRLKYTLVDVNTSILRNVNKLLVVKCLNDRQTERALLFAYEIAEAVKAIINYDSIDILEHVKGSDATFFGIDFKAIADLFEKIIFFLPEWKKKMAEAEKIVVENRKVQAEIDKIYAEINKTNAETHKIGQETDSMKYSSEFNNVDKIFQVIKSHKELGLRSVQIGGHLLITADKNNNFQLSIPSAFKDISGIVYEPKETQKPQLPSSKGEEIIKPQLKTRRRRK